MGEPKLRRLTGRLDAALVPADAVGSATSRSESVPDRNLLATARSLGAGTAVVEEQQAAAAAEPPLEAVAGRTGVEVPRWESEEPTRPVFSPDTGAGAVRGPAAPSGSQVWSAAAAAVGTYAGNPVVANATAVPAAGEVLIAGRPQLSMYSDAAAMAVGVAAGVPVVSRADVESAWAAAVAVADGLGCSVGYGEFELWDYRRDGSLEPV